MAGRRINVLFICTGNSCRSIMAECLLRRLGGDRFNAYSAGSRPAVAINPRARSLLEREGHAVTALRSKSWDEFAAPGAPALDMVITVCDSAAGETCPVWFGAPVAGHWGYPDPAAFVGGDAETEAFFAEIYRRIERRLRRFVALSRAGSDAGALRAVLDRLDREAIASEV